MSYTRIALTAAALALAGCGGDATEDDGARGDTSPRSAAVLNADGDVVATAMASGSAELSSDELEAGRNDSSWRRYLREEAAGAGSAAGDTAGVGTSSSRTASSDTAAGARADDPSGASRDSILRLQVLLDNARFSPGIIDGRWGKNTEKALYWFQKSNGMSATGNVDARTMSALEQAARVGEPVRSHTLTENDVAGPFEDLPEDVYARAEQPCLCYESLREKLGEVFHAAPELLETLNPDVDLNAVSAGQTLRVPAVEPFHLSELPDGKYTGGGEVARIVISDGGHYVHAMDDAGNIMYHFPSTLGSDYAPSPTGDFTVESITFDPTWHYKPDLLTGVDPSKEDAILPEGPNNAVGVVWMQLSKPHYGIHGTSAPETIGYVTSHGCVRLTNWDAGWLGQRIPPGVPVEFRDVGG